LALPDDENRKEQMFSTFARAGHPAGKFVWGNLITLRDNVKDDVLYEKLHKFRERHYSANRMTLTVQVYHKISLRSYLLSIIKYIMYLIYMMDLHIFAFIGKTISR